MDAILADMLPDHHLPYPVIFTRMAGAMVLGALIGFERERRERAAGLRTHILISLAASVFAIIALESAQMPMFSAERTQIDPLRVIEAVTSGVAFLAAGMIVFSRGQVRGLTTGAGMWLSGGVGLAVGLGFWALAVFASLACFITLGAIGKLMDRSVRPPHHAPEPAADPPTAADKPHPALHDAKARHE
jgi:putative Mg2+ transporter-C (MgtC) family protein